jgi:branched-chain amino acid transport system substrate-binding protein
MPRDDNARRGRSPSNRTVGRRRLLRAVGGTGVAGLTTGLTGCLSNLGGQGSDGDDGDDGDDGGDGGDGSDGGDGDAIEVTYGVLSPVSGAYSSLGPNQRRGAKLGIETVNESEDLNVQIEGVYEDTETSQEPALQAANRGVGNEGADFLMGAISSSVAIGLNSFAADNEVIYNPGGAAVPVTGAKCNEYVFRAETNTAQIAEAVAAYTVNNLGNDVWFHIADYAYGESVLSRVRSRMEQADSNLNVVGISRSELGAGNYDSYISDIRSSDADVAVLGMTGGDLITFVNQADGAGLKSSVDLMSPTMSFQAVRGALGPAAYGTYGGVRYTADTDELSNAQNESFVSAYMDKHDSPPDNFARVGYQSIMMTARGIHEAGSADPSAVIDALAGLEMDTILGPNQFRACDHQAMNPTWMGELVEPSGGSGPADVNLISKVEGEDAILPCEETGCEL